MVLQNWRSPIKPLLSLTIECVVTNLPYYANNHMQSLEMLPYHIKDRVLKKFTTSSRFWKNVDFKAILKAVVNTNTYIVNLTAASVDNDILDILSKAKKLKKLYLTSSKDYTFSGKGLINLFQHTKKLCFLVMLNCDECTDEVLECIAENCPQLAGLDIGGCKNVSDTGIRHLSKLGNLKWITLSHTQVSDEGISNLARGSSGKYIKELKIDNCGNITEDSLKTIAEYCPNIEILIFYSCVTARGETLSILQDGTFKNLKQLTWTVTW